MSDEAVRVDLTTAILALDRTIRKQTETDHTLIGLMKDQIAESKLSRAEQALLRTEVASLSNEMVILRRDVELIRDNQIGQRRERDANGR